MWDSEWCSSDGSPMARRSSAASRRGRAELGDHQGQLAGQVSDAGQEDDAGDEQGGEDGEHAGGEVLGVVAGPGDRHGTDGREELAESRWPSSRAARRCR